MLLNPRTLLLLPILLLATLALSATPASASPLHFGEPGEGAGQLNQPLGVAVDESTAPTDSSAGDVYVADEHNNRVDKFGPDGEFLLAWGWGVANGEEKLQACGPATGPSTEACHAGRSGPGAGEFHALRAVAVDASDQPLDDSEGDVYVLEEDNSRVDKFGPDGEFLLAWGWGVATGANEFQECGPEASPKPTETCEQGREGTGAGEFELKGGALTLGATGEVYVGDVSRVQVFGSDGKLARTVTIGPPEEFVDDIALDPAGDIYASFRNDRGVFEYKPCVGSCVAEQAGPPLETRSEDYFGLAPGGELFVSDGERLLEFAGGSLIASAPSPQNQAEGVAFDAQNGQLLVSVRSQGAVFAQAPLPPGPDVETEEATAEPAGTATLRASIDPEGKQTKYHLVYGVEGGPLTETAPVTMTAMEFEPEAVEVKLKGLVPGARYDYHFVASNANAPAGNSGAAQTFATLPALSIASESVSQVSSTSALLAGQLNPLGSETHYAFSYGPTSACGGTECTVPAGEGDAGSGIVDVPVSVLIEGLNPGVSYHYRLVARNPLAPGGIDGAEHTFTTQGSSSTPGLIDGRSWELVSPPQKHGASLEMPTGEAGVIQASEDGGAMTYFAYAPVGGEPAGSRSFADSQLLSKRQAPGIWGTEELATRQETVQGFITTYDSEYRLFSSDLSQGLVEPEGNTPLSSQTTERTSYLRQNPTCAEQPSNCYEPLLPARGLLPGVEFGGKEIVDQNGGGGAGFTESVQFVTGSPDLSHVVLRSKLALTEDFAPGFNEGESSLYEWSAGARGAGGALTLASVLPDGKPAAEAGAASQLGNSNRNVRNAISADGSRLVFWTSNEHLFLRDVSLGQTVQLDVPGEGVTGDIGGPAPTFVDASTNDSRVFFLDSQRLTPESTAGEGSQDLYMCEASAALEASEQDCAKHLKDLSVSLHAGEHADVEGVDLGVDESGTYIYFVAGGVLAPGAKAGEPNLYVEDTDTRKATLVATLSPPVGEVGRGDSPDWSAGPEHDNFGELTSRVSGNGQYLAFMSENSLTGYDNRDAFEGEYEGESKRGERVKVKGPFFDEEVFLYDRGSGSHPPTLRCVSCNPTGARPHGVHDSEVGCDGIRTLPLLVDRPCVWGGGSWLAGSLPGWPLVERGSALYQPRNLTNSGRVFFDSADALVPRDANGKEDVYEYEPEGTGPEAGRCGPAATGATRTFEPARSFEVNGTSGEEGAGCVGLISSGTSNEESAFMDASGMGPGGEEGEDVFFMTSARLAPQDLENDLNVYDAHECSAAQPCAPTTVDLPPACNTTDSCRTAPPPQPEVFGAPASATFHGPGNAAPPAPAKPKPLTRAQKLAAALKSCRSDQKKAKREKCERTAHKKFGAKASALKSTNKA